MLRHGDGVLLGSPRGDMLLQYLPWRVFGFGEMARGNLALWNPHIFSGRPFLGDFQSALFYPPNLVHLLLPHRMAINVTLILHVWLAGAFTYAWARRNDLSRPAATLGGMVAMLGGPFFLHVEAGHLTHVCTMAWTPAVLLGLDEAIRAGAAGAVRPAGRWVLAGMAAAALQVLAGHPQFVYYTALLSFAFVLAHVIVPGLAPRAPVPAPRRAWPLAAWALTWSGGAGLAVAQLLAGVEAARESGRWQETSQAFSGTFSLPLENLPTLVAPHLFGGGSEPYFGRWFAWEVTIFVGASTLLLAALARGRRAAVEAAMVAIALLLATGPELPVFGLAYDVLPGFQVFRAPARLAATVLPVIGLLAARGLDQARRAGPPLRAPFMAALGAVAMAALAWLPGTGAWDVLVVRMQTAPVREVAPAVLTQPVFAASARAFTARQLLLAAAVFAIGAALLAAARRRRPAVYGLAVLAAAELVAFGQAHRWTSPPLMPYPPLWRDTVASAGEARVRHTREWFANQGMVSGHLDVWGYDASVPARYVALVQALDDAAARDGETAVRLRGVVAMLRWRYLFGATPQGQPALITVGDPMPRAALVEEVRVIPDRVEMLRAILSADFDPRRRVLLETAPDPAPAAAGGPSGDVRVIASGTDTLDLEVKAPRAAVLVVTDAFAGGWRAVSLGDAPQSRYEVLPANLALRAVPLAAGHHRLRLEYAPTAFRIGCFLSIAAVLVWVAAAVALSRRAR